MWTGNPVELLGTSLGAVSTITLFVVNLLFLLGYRKVSYTAVYLSVSNQRLGPVSSGVVTWCQGFESHNQLPFIARCSLNYVPLPSVKQFASLPLVISESRRLKEDS